MKKRTVWIVRAIGSLLMLPVLAVVVYTLPQIHSVLILWLAKTLHKPATTTGGSVL